MKIIVPFSKNLIKKFCCWRESNPRQAGHKNIYTYWTMSLTDWAIAADGLLRYLYLCIGRSTKIRRWWTAHAWPASGINPLYFRWQPSLRSTAGYSILLDYIEISYWIDKFDLLSNSKNIRHRGHRSCYFKQNKNIVQKM